MWQWIGQIFGFYKAGVPTIVSDDDPLPVDTGLVIPTPQTDALTAAELTAEDLSKELTQQRRLGGGKIPIPFTVTVAATPFDYAPAAGKKIQLFWALAAAEPFSATGANVFPQISIKIGTLECYRTRGSVAHWEFFEGAIDEHLTVTISHDVIVDGVLHILEV
jgi:hypothetical protein